MPDKRRMERSLPMREIKEASKEIDKAKNALAKAELKINKLQKLDKSIGLKAQALE